MEKNVGTTDKIIRIIVGIAALVAGYSFGGWLLYAGIVIAIAAFATAAFSFCGLYTIMGWNTCPMKVKNDKKK